MAFPIGMHDGNTLMYLEKFKIPTPCPDAPRLVFEGLVIRLSAKQLYKRPSGAPSQSWHGA